MCGLSLKKSLPVGTVWVEQLKNNFNSFFLRTTQACDCLHLLHPHEEQRLLADNSAKTQRTHCAINPKSTCVRNSNYNIQIWKIQHMTCDNVNLERVAHCQSAMFISHQTMWVECKRWHETKRTKNLMKLYVFGNYWSGR